MPTQDDFPEKWACQSPNKKVRVEVRVADAGAESGYRWIEIPTQSVEQYIEKGEAARIQRATKVRFPTEWGSVGGNLTNSPTKLIRQYDSSAPDDTLPGLRGPESLVGRDDPFTWARISYRDQRRDDANWIITEMGWIGGLGPASDTGMSKMWVYDPAELLSGTAIGVTFKKPTVTQAVEKLAKLINDNTPIPLSEVELVTPETEDEFQKVISQVESDDIQGGFSPDDQQVVYRYKHNRVQSADGTFGRYAPVEEGQNYYAAVITTGKETSIFSPDPLGAKSFRTNKHTLQDVVDYLEGKMGAKMHFEPNPGGHAVRLVVDIEPERRVFAQDYVAERAKEDGDDDYEIFQTVSVLKNDALYEMKPVNTLRVDGETGAGFLDAAADWLERAQEVGLHGREATTSNKFPYAKVQVPSLLEAAEGIELGPRIESGATTESEVIETAKTELTKLLEEAGEGEVVMKGAPEILPFDALDSFEVCDDQVIFEQQPVRYEIESVRHTAKANDIYKTRVLVSVWANEKNIVVVESGMEDITTTQGGGSDDGIFVG